MAPRLTRFVPGSFSVPNTRRSELYLEWGAEDDERRLWLREHLDHDAPSGPPSYGYIELVELPEHPHVRSLVDLEAALAARFEAHPLANQLPGATALVESALAGSTSPLEAAPIAARYLCPAGVARGLGAALGRLEGSAFRQPGDVGGAELRAFAPICEVLQLGVLECAAGSGDVVRALLGDVPRSRARRCKAMMGAGTRMYAELMTRRSLNTFVRLLNASSERWRARRKASPRLRARRCQAASGRPRKRSPKSTTRSRGRLPFSARTRSTKPFGSSMVSQ